ncbi:MAG TPA: hypothetical protein VF798_12055, partial [Burkholderiaceae bacterium]
PDAAKTGRKRNLPWMLVTVLGLAAFIAWRMTNVHTGGNESGRAIVMRLQTGSEVTVRQASYACNTAEALNRSVAFRLAGAEDKLRARTQHECMPILPRQRLKLAAMKDKLAQVEIGTSPVPLWVAVGDLVPADSPAP